MLLKPYLSPLYFFTHAAALAAAPPKSKSTPLATVSAIIRVRFLSLPGSEDSVEFDKSVEFSIIVDVTEFMTLVEFSAMVEEIELTTLVALSAIDEENKELIMLEGM